MFFMYIDRGCVGTGEIMLSSVCLLTEVALLYWRLTYVLYVY